jgi:hypothetical protein
MSHDVFISHSSKDKTIADATCAALENAGIRCWVAPRDILPGVNWGEAIVDAIAGSRVMVLILSSESNVSQQVVREIERGVSKGIPIIPLRIQDIPLSKSLEYFLSSAHWLDAYSQPFQKHLNPLIGCVQTLLSGSTVRPADVKLHTMRARSSQSPLRVPLWAVGSILAALGIATVFYFATRRAPQQGAPVVVKDETAAIAPDTRLIKESMVEQSANVSNANVGGLIQDPKSPADFYHNARLQELSGRFGDAFDSYKHYVGMNEEFIDPCLSYVRLLESQRGHLAAETEFASLAKQFPRNRAIALTVASLRAGNDKREALEAFADAHPDFGPAFWLAAREYSTDVLRTQSAIAVERERDLLQAVVRRHESEEFSRYFLDKKDAEARAQDAVRRLNEISSRRAGVRMRLAEYSPLMGPAGWYPLDSMMYVLISDTHVKSVSFRLAEEPWMEVPAKLVLPPEDQSTEVGWTWRMLSPADCDKVFVNGDTEAVVWFKYIDADGMESPPVPVFRVRRFGAGMFALKPESEQPVRTQPASP